MSNEFKHLAHDSSVQSQVIYESVDEHVADGQTTGDLLYFDGNHWVRKAQGFLNKVDYVLAAANSDATMKLTADKVCTGTNGNPIDHTNINAALASYRNVLLLKGDYYFSAALPFVAGQDFGGQGRTNTLLHNNGSTHGIYVAGISGSRINDSRIHDMAIRGNAQALAGLYATWNYGPNVVERVQLQGHAYGAQLGNNAADFTFYDTRFDSNIVGVNLQVSSNPSSFFHCIWSSNTTYHLLIDGNTNETMIFGGNMNGAGLQAIYIISPMRTFNCIGTHFEYNGLSTVNDTTRTHVLINNADAVNLRFLNCWYNGENSSQVAFTNHAITLVDGSNVVADNCGFRKLVTSCYDISVGKTLYEWLTYIESATVPAVNSGAGTLKSIQTA